MCGIIGQYSRKFVDKNNFIKMRDSLSHRGPDDAGVIFLENGKLAFGHRRLSIIDLSHRGRQPMHSEDNKIWLVVNGEIYNYKSLKKELLILGHRFISDSDSEVLVHGYEEWGIDGLLERINGMFAFALYDASKKIIFLARDRFGIKPLYYYENGSDFIFSSEIKGIIASAVFKKNLKFRAVCDFLIHRFVPSPDTMWDNVKKVRPGYYCAIDIDSLKSVEKKYWNLNINNKKINVNEAVEHFDYLLKKSIEEHIVSDVPVGIFLSGGYDSSAIVYYLHLIGYKPKSFTIGFKNYDKSEHIYAKEVAEKFSLNHTEYFMGEEISEYVKSLSYYFDDPVGGTSTMPTYEVSRLAGRNMKVVMGGDGGDEILAGYNWYKSILKKSPNYSELAKEYYLNSISSVPFDYSDINKLFNYPLKNEDLPDDYYWIYENVIDSNYDILKNLQLIDLTLFLPEIVLAKVDKASMANSLEVRVPFLDHRLVEFLFSLDSGIYYRENYSKFLLYEILKNVYSENLLFKFKKGFSAPLYEKNIAFAINELRNGSLIKKGILNKDVFDDFLKTGYKEFFWNLYILQEWMNRWVM